MSDQRAYSSDAFNRLPFREQLDALYGISAKDRRDLILSAPNAGRLVRSFAAESLFHTLKELGLEDGGDLLALASGEQICALVDLDCWKKDRLETKLLLDWLEPLMEGGERAVGEFLNTVDRDLLELFLKRFVRVHRRDDPEEPEDDQEGQEIFELDEHYQIIFHHWDARVPLVRQLIEALYERDYSYFVTVMEDITWAVESELEESSFRLRNARLQDRGFPDYYDAQDIYRPLPASELPARAQPLGRGGETDAQAFAAGQALVLPDSGSSLFALALNAGFAGDAAAELRHELAYLVNRVLVADGVDFADRDRIADKIKTAHDVVNVALESIAGLDVGAAVQTLERHYVQHLFRVSWAILFDLRKRAKSVVETLGIGSAPTEHAFLDGPFREAIAGFLRPRPDYFEGIDRAGEIRYRSFASMADVERATLLLDDLGSLGEACQRLLGRSLPELARLRPRDADDFRVSAVLLTAFARAVLDGTPSLDPLGPDDLARLREATLDAATGKLDETLRRKFLERFAEHGGYVDWSLRRFDDEFLALAADAPPDPRFVTCLMIRADEPSPRAA